MRHFSYSVSWKGSSVFLGDCYFPLLPVSRKSHSSHSPLICIFILACYFARTWRCTGGSMSVLASISILQESVLFPSLLLHLQSVTFAGKLSFTQLKQTTETYMLPYASIRLCIILFYNYSFMYCIHQTESSSRGWIMPPSPCIRNGTWEQFVE